MSAVDRIRTYQDALIAIRQDLHRHPELGLEEHRTAGIVAGPQIVFITSVSSVSSGKTLNWCRCCIPIWSRSKPIPARSNRSS